VTGSLASFTGTSGNDTADAITGTLTGFGYGTVTELQDAVGDSFSAGAGNDTVVGGVGDDSIDGDSGDDSIQSRAGNDTIVINSFGSDSVDGGEDDDRLQLFQDDAVVDINISYTNVTGENIQNIEVVDVSTGLGNDNINVSAAAGSPNFWGSNSIITGTGNDTVVGGSGANNIDGGDGNDDLNGGASDDFILGGAGDDILLGENGNDFLGSDGLGADIVDGGAGDDRFQLLNDVTTTAINFSYTSATGGNIQNIESVDIQTGLGDDNINASAALGTPNILGNNFIFTAGGDDTVIGGGGADDISGGDGLDYLIGGAGNDSLDGGNDSDILIGSNGDSDTLIGGAGDDVYEVYANTTIIETGSDERDRVYADSNYTLGANQEYLLLWGTGNINGTGNSENNALFGNVGNNQLNGGAGNDYLNGGAGNDALDGGEGSDVLIGGNSDLDTLVGGSGDDVYEVYTGNVITEAAGEGIDWVYAVVDYTLGANLENLVLWETANINGTGNSEDNYLYGNVGNNLLAGGTGNDSLFGGVGNDSLTGGLGNDEFTFRGGFGTLGVDTITDADFTLTADKIALSKTTFNLTSAVTTGVNFGFSVADEFASVSGSADTSSALIVYNSSTGSLFYNQNGSDAGFGAGGQFAVLTGNPALTATNFVLLA
jgi:Ca2+-binding RTX toxin-like protein